MGNYFVSSQWGSQSKVLGDRNLKLFFYLAKRDRMGIFVVSVPRKLVNDFQRQCFLFKLALKNSERKRS